MSSVVQFSVGQKLLMVAVGNYEKMWNKCTSFVADTLIARAAMTLLTKPSQEQKKDREAVGITKAVLGSNWFRSIQSNRIE